MAITWNDLPLTAAQRTVAQELEALGAQLPARPVNSPIAGIVPTNTLVQAKRSQDWLKEMGTFLQNAHRGTQYVLMYHRTLAAKAFEDANP
jgi:hypothetical protein